MFGDIFLEVLSALIVLEIVKEVYYQYWTVPQALKRNQEAFEKLENKLQEELMKNTNALYNTITEYEQETPTPTKRTKKSKLN